MKLIGKFIDKNNELLFCRSIDCIEHAMLIADRMGTDNCSRIEFYTRTKSYKRTEGLFGESSIDFVSAYIKNKATNQWTIEDVDLVNLTFPQGCIK